MTIALRIAVLVAALLGYLLHSAMRPSGRLEGMGLGWVEFDFVRQALSDFSVWFALPYLLLITGIAFSTRSALITVVIAIGAVAYLDYSGFQGPRDTGWHIVLSPVLLLIPAAIGLGVAALVNRRHKRLHADTGKETPSSGDSINVPKGDV